MIGKPIQPPTTPFKSFKNLNNYLTGNRKGDNPSEKIAYADCINLDSLDNATVVMDILAEQRDMRCKDPVFHCVLSWQEGEIPTKEQAHEAAMITLKELNLEECCAVYGVHKDTHNIHLQMSVCRIHPDTKKAIAPANWWTKKAMERVARIVEYKQGWKVENNAWSEINREGNIIEKQPVIDKPIPQKAVDMENLTGEVSAMRKAKELITGKLDCINTWQEFHKLIYDNGMEYSKKGSGAIIKIGDIQVKASNVTRNISMRNLEKRFGEYEEPVAGLSLNIEKSEANKEPKPLNKINDNPSWQTFITARKEYYANKKKHREKTSKRHSEAKRELQKRQKEESEKFYEESFGKNSKQIAQERSILAVKHKIEKLALRDIQKEERDNYQRKNPSYPSYEEWLLRQNKLFEAENWRHRRDKEPTLRNEIVGADEELEGSRFKDIRGFSFAKSPYGIRFMNKETPNILSFIDMGKKINLYRNDESSMIAAMQLGAQKWGTIQINGTEEFKRRCAEMAVEHGIKIKNPELQEYIKELNVKRNESLKEAHKMANELQNFKDYHEAVGAERYKVTATEFFDDGTKRGFMVNNRDGAPDGFTPEEVEKKMQRLLGLKEAGRNIYYTPISEGKHHLLIDDMDNVKLTDLIMDGYRPAAVIESSPGNWQAIITIPKLGTDMDREIGNAIVAKLNKEYGDPKVSGELHAHRAPGFDNKKAKHRRPDGSFPEVLLKQHHKVECDKTIELSKAIRAEMEQERTGEAEKMKKMLERVSRQHGNAVTDTNTAYIAHFQDILRLQKNAGRSIDKIDASRMDAMIGVRLRATGHTKEQIAGTLKVMAPEIRKEFGSAGTHQWNEYSERTANYVFSYAGDKAMKDKARWFKNWEKIEKNVGKVSVREGESKTPVSVRETPKRSSFNDMGM
jgi:hypothetical protein